MLIGKNVALRPMTMADQQWLVEWYNDPEFFGKYFNVWPTSREREERLFPGHSRDYDHESGDYIITSRDQGEAMGVIGHFKPFAIGVFHGQEMGYEVHQRFRGQGIATQAACLLVNHLFDATTVNRIQATVVVGNDASCRVLEKAGLRQDGILRGVFYLHGRFTDMHMYSIVRADWSDEASYRSGGREF
jgi:[ribosomal protein S5]-alanine N-acetyltransferase